MKPRKLDPERIDAGNPELTREELRRARPASEVLPGLIGRKATDELMRRGRGRPLKGEGKGWQTRINAVLRERRPSLLALVLSGSPRRTGGRICDKASEVLNIETRRYGNTRTAKELWKLPFRSLSGTMKSEGLCDEQLTKGNWQPDGGGEI